MPIPPDTVGATPTPEALRADGVVRAFGRRRAVDGVSVALGPGECLALFGPNGAGKTTLLRMLGGLLRPTAGQVRLHGTPLPGPAAVRGLVGLLSHQAMLYPVLTVRENVRFAAECQGIVDADAAVSDVLDRLRVRDREHVPVRLLSRGLQQRVSIARALVHAPRLLLLDEPYTGLDEVGAAAFTEALQALQDGGATLVLVTHNLAEGLALATRAAVMRTGRLVHEEDRPAGGFDLVAFQQRYRGLAHEAIA